MSTSTTRALLLPLLALLALTLPGQIVGPPVALPGDAGIGAAAGIQEQPAIAFGAGIYLAVWADLRTDFVSSGITIQQQNAFDIFATRLDAAGGAIDVTPFAISTEFGAQREPQVAWNGSHWLVVWTTEGFNGPSTSHSDHVMAARVAPNGTVVDAPPIQVHAFGTSTSSVVRVAGNGPDWLVEFGGSTVGENSLRGVRIAGNGAVLDPTPVTLVQAGFSVYLDVELVSAAGEYLLAYGSAGSSSTARRFSANLTPIGGAFAVPSHLIASNGTSYYVVWNGAGVLVGSPMSTNGTLTMPAGAYITASAWHGLVDLTWDGVNWWTTVDRTALGITMARIAPNGTVLDPGGLPYAPALWRVMDWHDSAGAANGGIVMVWRDAQLAGLDDEDVRALSISAAAVPGTERIVSTAAATQRFPDLAAGDGRYLAVFLSEYSGVRRVTYQLLDAGGIAIDPQPVLLAAGPAIGEQPFAADLRGPRVAWNGSLYLVVWSSNGSVFAQRVAADGSLVDPAPFLVAAGFAPDVEALGSTFLVVATHTTAAAHWVQPYRARIDGASGALLDPPADLDLYFARHPHVCRFDGRWLATWQRNGSHDDPNCNVRAAFIDASGTIGPAFTVAYNAGRPDVAGGADRALFVFRSGSDTVNNPSIAAQRMLTNGTLLDGNGFTVASAAFGQTHPRVIAEADGFVAAWEDRRNAQAYYDRRTDVYATRFARNGTALGGLFPIHDVVQPAERPVLATLGGRPLSAAAVFHPEAPLTSFRIDSSLLHYGFERYGGGIAGTGALVPALAGSGNPIPGRTVTLELSNGLGGALSGLLVGFGPGTQVSQPLFGGTIHVQPAFSVPLQLGGAAGGAGAGGASLPIPIPTGTAFVGLNVNFQAVLLDIAAPAGLSMSPALALWIG